MEGFRGFAVFLVFIVHYSTLSQPWIPAGSVTSDIANYLHSIGNTGVDLFFVLSGYLIYGMLIKRNQPFNSYLARRVQRIYPTFLVVLMIYLVLSVALPGESKIPGEGAIWYVISNVLLLPGMLDIQPIITVAWSLSYEFFFYLVTPPMIYALRLRQRTPTWRIVLLLGVGVAGFGYAYGTGSEYTRLLMFVAGMLLYETVNHTQFRINRGIGLIALATALAAVPLIPGWYKYLGLCIVFYLLCLDAFCNTNSITARVFSWTPLRWYGNMSYSYYLIHGLTLKAGFMVLGLLLAGSSSVYYWVLLLPMFILTLIVSGLLFALVEKPFSLSVTPHPDRRRTASAPHSHAITHQSHQSHTDPTRESQL